ncbi:MAG: inositol monophosphatase family protein [Aestuariivirgaceae bacterium]
MNDADLELRLRFGQAIAVEAGRQAREHFDRRHELTIEYKGVQNLVSEADRMCEHTISTAIGRAFPSDVVIGEEHGHHNPGGGVLWVIDPIDGTTNFLRGLPLWCVSIGLLVENIPVAGIIYNPVTEELYWGLRGGGAWRNGSRIKVSRASKLEESRIGMSFSYRRSLETHVEAVTACFAARCEFTRLGSSALGMALTADGRLDGFWASHAFAWDVAAGMILVQEAGGWVSDFLGCDGLNEGNMILAAPQGLAAALRKLLAM